MAAFDAHTWYVLRSAIDSSNNTLTAGTNTQAAFDPNSPSAIYYAPSTGDIPTYQQWQLFGVNSSSSAAYVLRNRQYGPDAYLTTAWTTRKCGGGACATVPVLSPDINAESLWNFASWGWSDSTGGAYMYNVGNGSAWRMDVMDGGVAPELVNYDDTGRLAQHWTLSAYTTFAASDTSSFSQVPTTAAALLAQYTDGASITPYTTSSTATASSTGVSSTSSSAGTSSAQPANAKSGLSAGAAAGIGVAAALVFVVVALVIAFFYYKRRKARRAGTSSNPAELGGSHSSNRSMVHETKHATVSPPVAVGSPYTDAELSHPSEPLRPEMMHPSDSSRSEMLHPSEGSRSELEHPSTRTSGTWNSSHPTWSTKAR